MACIYHPKTPVLDWPLATEHLGLLRVSENDLNWSDPLLAPKDCCPFPTQNQGHDWVLGLHIKFLSVLSCVLTPGIDATVQAKTILPESCHVLVCNSKTTVKEAETEAVHLVFLQKTLVGQNQSASALFTLIG